MVTQHRFACWRFRVWRERVTEARLIWQLSGAWAEQFPGPGANSMQLADEAALNRALTRRVKWKRKACENCRRRVLRSGGPVKPVPDLPYPGRPE
jgi:hypothetical protein